MTDAETIKQIRKTLEDRGWLDPSVDLVHGINLIVDLVEGYQKSLSDLRASIEDKHLVFPK